MTNVIMYKYIETDRSIPTKSFNKYCQDTLNNQLSCNAYWLDGQRALIEDYIRTKNNLRAW